MIHVSKALNDESCNSCHSQDNVYQLQGEKSTVVYRLCKECIAEVCQAVNPRPPKALRRKR